MRNSSPAFILTLLTSLVATSCSNGIATDAHPLSPAGLPGGPQGVAGVEEIHSQNQFGSELVRTVAKSELAADPNRNVFLSPLSASVALQMLLNASPEGG